MGSLEGRYERTGRGIHPLHLMFLIAGMVLVFPLLLYMLFAVVFLLVPGGMD
jgi:hypothetical protein